MPTFLLFLIGFETIFFTYIFHKNELFWIKLILLKLKNYQQLRKTRTPICIKFCLLNIRDLKTSIRKEKHMSFYDYWLLVNITRRKMGNWKKLKRAILENNVNIQKQPLEVFYKISCS